MFDVMSRCGHGKLPFAITFQSSEVSLDETSQVVHLFASYYSIIQTLFSRFPDSAVDARHIRDYDSRDEARYRAERVLRWPPLIISPIDNPPVSLSVLGPFCVSESLT